VVTRSLKLLSVIMALTAVQSVLAGDPLAAVRAACTADAQKFYAGVAPGGGRIIACLKERRLRMRTQKIEQTGTPFRAPGGPLTPVAAAVLIGGLLSSLSRDELIAAVAFTAVSTIAYAAHAKLRRPIGNPAASG
jgi:hypothetical protein